MLAVHICICWNVCQLCFQDTLTSISAKRLSPSISSQIEPDRLRYRRHRPCFPDIRERVLLSADMSETNRSALREFIAVWCMYYSPEPHLLTYITVHCNYQGRPVQHYCTTISPSISVHSRVPIVLGGASFDIRSAGFGTKPSEASFTCAQMVPGGSQTATVCWP